jgi:FMN phosphatase YigB (HAD superfamily)
MFLNHWRIKRLIRQNNPATITVDVFDTLLMRKIYPEDLQFLKHAKEASKILETTLGKRIDSKTFYGFRKYARSIIDECKQQKKLDRESHIEEIFSLLIRGLSQKHHVSIDTPQEKQLISQLIEKELELEWKYLKLNKSLIKLLRKQKEAGKKIYFISDIYLDTKHIRQLFERFGILDLFEGGICSANVGYCKGSGKLFKKITQKKILKDVSPLSNVHIGDNRISDFISAKRFGHLAFHYKTWHHRPLRPLKKIWGSILLHFKLAGHHRKIRSQHHQQLKTHLKSLSSHKKILFETGYRMAPSLLYYISHLDLSSSFKKSPIVFLSSEGEYFEKLFEILSIPNKTTTLSLFNRINTLRAFAYLSLTQPLIKYSEAIIHLFFHGEGKRTLKDLLKSMGIKQEELGITDLALHHMPAEKFIKRLIKVLRKHEHPQLKESYQKMLRELSESGILNHEKIMLADVGWNGTIQILLEQIFQLLRKDIKTFGMYLGYTGHNIFGLQEIKNMKGVVYRGIHDPYFKTMLVEEIWEYILTNKNKNDERIQWIQAGLEAFCKDYTKLEYSPDRLFDLTKKPLKKLFYHPNRQQILLLGAIEHDAGFGVDTQRSLIDFNHSSWKLIKMMALQPDQFKHLYLSQYWERGFLKWYRLTLIQPVISGMRWLKNKNMEIFG